jgi:hypothetical protein
MVTLFFLVVMIFIYYFNIDDINKMLFNFIEGIYEDYYNISYGDKAARLAGLGFLISGGYEPFGYGLLSYYNPVYKTWLFNAGFSTTYTLILDVGIIYTILFYVISIVFILGKRLSSPIHMLVLISSAVFSQFGLVFYSGDFILGMIMCLSILNQDNFNSETLLNNNSGI